MHKKEEPTLGNGKVLESPQQDTRFSGKILRFTGESLKAPRKESITNNPLLLPTFETASSTMVSIVSKRSIGSGRLITNELAGTSAERINDCK